MIGSGRDLSLNERQPVILGKGHAVTGFIDLIERHQVAMLIDLTHCLARAGLDSARKEGLTIVAQCPLVSEYLRRHPGIADER